MQAMNPVVDRRKMKQAHDVTYLSENSPLMPRRYESEEEEVSEAETNGHGRMYSPVDGDSDVGAFDSELSADEQASDDVQDKPRDMSHRNTLSSHLSASQKSRPVSIATVKRSSAATFVPGSLYHDSDDDEIMSSTTPLMTSPMSSPFLTGTTVLVPEDASESEVNLYHQSSNRDSVSSEEDLDMVSSLLVATPIIFKIPSSRPKLIWISSNRSRLMKQDNVSRLGRSSSKRSRSSGSVRSGTRPRRRRSHKRQSSSLSLSSTQSVEPYVAPSTTLRRQARRSTVRSSSVPQVSSVQRRDNSRSRSRSRNREAMFFDSPTLGFLTGGTRVGEADTSATITNFSEIPPMPHPLSPRSMSVSFPVPLSFSPEGELVTPYSQRPTSSIGPLPTPRRISSFNSVDTTGVQRSTFLSSPDFGKPFKPIIPYMSLQKKKSGRGSRSISMSFRLQSQDEGSKPPLTESPVSYRPFPDLGHQRSNTTLGGDFGSRRPNATYPNVRDSSMSFIPLDARSSSTTDLGSTVDHLTGLGYDVNVSSYTSKDKSQKRTRDRGDSQSRLVGKAFMGFRLGRKKRTSTPTHDN